MKVVCQICGIVYDDTIVKPVCCIRRPKLITDAQAVQAIANKLVSTWVPSIGGAG